MLAVVVVVVIRWEVCGVVVVVLQITLVGLVTNVCCFKSCCRRR